mgnify:CR=1 FL=1
MIWLPGIDYLPMSIADYDNSKLTIFFSIRGEGTAALASFKDKVVGIVGPLGKPLSINTRSRYLLVAGGTGLAPIIRLAKELNSLGIPTTIVWGTRKGENVGEVPTFFKEITGLDLHICTEDCSIGFCGKAIDLVNELIPKLKPAEIVAAGPNDMLAEIAYLSFKSGINPVLILESIIKCGLGVCGSCVLGTTGLRLCKEGPAIKASKVIDYLIKYLPESRRKEVISKGLPYVT